MIKVISIIYVDTDDPEVALAVVNDYFEFGDPVMSDEARHRIAGWEVEVEDPVELGLVRLQ